MSFETQGTRFAHRSYANLTDYEREQVSQEKPRQWVPYALAFMFVAIAVLYLLYMYGVLGNQKSKYVNPMTANANANANAMAYTWTENMAPFTA